MDYNWLDHTSWHSSEASPMSLGTVKGEKEKLVSRQFCRILTPCVKGKRKWCALEATHWKRNWNGLSLRLKTLG
ncbi:hypothetical protein FKM82_005875 [Ascaphus truei]